ncbi:MAG: endonuclease/exonuclease/phosphatase family protein [Ferruginibacter sp.]
MIVLIDWKPITNIFPLRFPYSFEVKKQSGSLRIMSWNVEQFEILHSNQHPELRQEMFDLINTYQPDIACFQEMVCADSTVTKANTPYFKRYYKQFGLYFLDDFINGLHFPYHFYAYNPIDNFLVDEHFGIIIFSKYPIIHKQMLSYFPYDYNYNFEYVDILKGNDTIRVFNIHLQSLHFTSSNLGYMTAFR